MLFDIVAVNFLKYKVDKVHETTVQRITYHMKELVQKSFIAQHTEMNCKSIHMSVISLMIH
jgi:hypothetical protein